MKPLASAAFIRLRSSLVLPSLMVFTCAAIHTAQAADITWNVAGPSPWTTGTNWSTGTVPSGTDRAIILNSGQATVATGDAIAINTFRLVNGTLSMTGGLISALSTSQSDNVRIGDYTFNQTVGTVALTMSGTSSITSAGLISFADGDGATPVVTTVTATLSDTAAVTANNDYMIIGRNHGTANVTLNNSAVIEKKGTTNTFLIGDGALGTGTVTLKDTSALKSANQFVIGNGTGSVGSVNLQGSSTLASTGGNVTIGNASGSVGSVALQDSSKLTATSTVILGNANTASGSITLQGTSAVTFTGEIYVGNASGGTGTLTISDSATVTKTGTSGFITAARSNGTGTINVEGSGKLISQNAVRLAEGATANATLNAKGNAVVQVTNGMQIGYQGTGKAVISDSAQATVGGAVNIGFGAATATGTLQMSGGTFAVGGALTVGTDSAKGSLLMTGGIINATAVGSPPTSPPTSVVGGGATAVATVTLSGNSAINAGGIKWKTGDLGGTDTTRVGTTAITLNGSSSLTLNQFTIGHIGGDTSSTNVTVNDAATLMVNDFITIGRDDAGTNGTMAVHLNLNGGTLATKRILAGGGPSTWSPTNNNIIANGGSIKALADQSDFFQTTQYNANRSSVSLAAGGLTFNTNGFTVGIKNVLGGTGGLTKTGEGKLNLSTPQTFTGTTTIGQGILDLEPSAALAGPCLVSAGGTLSLSGERFSPVSLPDLTFSAGSSLAVSNPNYSSAIDATTGLTVNGTVTVGITGPLSIGDFPLINHPAGAINGVGTFQVGSLGRSVVANISDIENVVTLQVTALNPVQWKGNVNSAWDVNATSNWTFNNATSKYLQNDYVLFGDSATSSAVVLNATVSPYNVTFDNTDINYTISGTGGIAGTTGLTKTGGGMLTLATANTYTGTTLVEGGTLKFGDGTSNGSIVGPLTVNGTNVIFNPTGTSTIAGSLSGSGSDSSLTKTGAGTQTILWTANAYSGLFNINEGTVKFGNATANGALGTSTLYNVASGATLALDALTAVALPSGNITGAGLVTLNSAQAVNGSANWGTLAFPSGFTGTLQVLKGRVGASTSAGLGGTSSLKLADGSQILLSTSTDPYTTPIQIAGLGWGEGGYNQGALRAAAYNTVVWNGNVTLTADSGIVSQWGANFTVTGPISGAFALQLFAQSGGETTNFGTVTLAPAAPVRNSYGTTRINGDVPATTTSGVRGVVMAGNQYAFSTGPLEVSNATMKLNGYSFSFASLTGAGGSIGNFSASSPSVLTVGGAAASTYAGTIVDGGAGKLAFEKNGTGTLTLTGANTYTGGTTVHTGTLSVSTAFFNDASAITVDSGAVLNLNTGAADTVGTLFLGGVQLPAGTYGPTTPTYGAYFTGTGTLIVTNGPSAAGYATWATNAGLTAANNGLTADPDNDGIANLLEFYLDGNPLVSSTAILPTQTLDATYLTLTFRRRDDSESDVASQVVEFGTTLAGWTTRAIGATSSPADGNGVIVTVTENDTAPDTIVVQIPRALAPGGALFARLKVAK